MSISRGGCGAERDRRLREVRVVHTWSTRLGLRGDRQLRPSPACGNHVDLPCPSG
jgi:hypothetical protein